MVKINDVRRSAQPKDFCWGEWASSDLDEELQEQQKKLL